MGGGACYFIGNVLFGLDDLIHIVVNGLIAEEVIAIHCVLLSVAMRSVFCLLAVAVSPGELNEADSGGCREGQSRTARLVVEDYELAVGVIRKRSTAFCF